MRKRDITSISAKLNRLIYQAYLPLVVMTVLILLLLIVYFLQSSAVNRNIITASSFSQNFKNDVDLKMYYFVSGSSDELPRGEVETAKALAQELLENAGNNESRQAINSVLNLCNSLNRSITNIEETDGYDKRMEQLDANIYVITSLIEEYIYNYLYYEAGELARLQRQQNIWLVVEIITTAVVMALLLLTSYRRAAQTSRSITDPVDALYERVTEIGQGDLSQKEPVAADDEKLNALSVGIEQMVSRLNDQIELTRQEQIRLRGIQLSLLQAQINPHFLYNTLDAIVWLIETGKNQQAEEMITSLSTYFRSFLSDGKDIVTLAEEERHVHSYLEIQQVRYRDILSYEISIDESLNECELPKLTLQPLVENAIYHGIKPKRGKGLIKVTGWTQNDTAVLTVADTGVGIAADKLELLKASLRQDDRAGFGLTAVYKRLKLMYGSDCDITIASTSNEGTTITIRIPLKAEVRHETDQ